MKIEYDRAVVIHIGFLGFVSFIVDDGPTGSTMIPCEVLDIKGQTVEITPCAGDRTCFWITRDQIYSKRS